RLWDDGPGLALVGGRSAQSDQGAVLLFPFLREAVAGVVRGQPRPRPGHAAPLRAQTPYAQVAGDHGGARAVRNGGCLPRRLPPYAATATAGGPPHAGARRDLSSRARGRVAAGHVPRRPPLLSCASAARRAPVAFPRAGGFTDP